MQQNRPASRNDLFYKMRINNTSKKQKRHRWHVILTLHYKRTNQNGQVNTQLSNNLNMRFLHLATQTQLQPFVCLQKPLAR